jgi:hypothetical protein
MTIACRHEFRLCIALICLREAVNENHTRLGRMDKAVRGKDVILRPPRG